MARSLVSLFGLCLLFPLSAGADEPAVDLRGPDPKPGLRLREVSRFDMKGADFTLKAEGKVLATIKLDMTQVEETEVTVKAAEGRAVTKFTTRVMKDETTTTMRGPGDKETEEEIGDLAGQLVVSERGQSGWKHTLAEGEPTKAQKEALADMSPWDDEDEIPAGKQKIGASWEMDAVHIKKLVGASWTALSGKMKVTFYGIRTYNDELCAMIQSTGSIKGRIKTEGDSNLLATMEIKITEYRSLKSGVTLKTDGEVTLKASGKQKIEGNDTDIVLEGKAQVESTTEVR